MDVIGILYTVIASYLLCGFIVLSVILLIVSGPWYIWDCIVTSYKRPSIVEFLMILTIWPVLVFDELNHRKRLTKMIQALKLHRLLMLRWVFLLICVSLCSASFGAYVWGINGTCVNRLEPCYCSVPINTCGSAVDCWNMSRSIRSDYVGMMIPQSSVIPTGLTFNGGHVWGLNGSCIYSGKLNVCYQTFAPKLCRTWSECLVIASDMNRRTAFVALSFSS